MLRQQLVMILDNQPNIVDKKIYIWGTGNTALLYQEGLKRLEKEDSFHIDGYVDNDSHKWGKPFSGKPVISPQELMKQGNACVLICSPQPHVVGEVRQQITQLQVEGYHIDEVILKLHRNEVLQCFDLLEDTMSKEVYAHIIMCRIQGKYPEEAYVSPEQYFLLKQFRRRDAKEVFVDCGAFVGDSMERYIWKKDGVFKKIIAFEPDENNYRSLETRITRLKAEWNFKTEQIEIYPYGVSESGTYAAVERDLTNNGLSSKITEGIAEDCEGCRIISIDNFVKEPFSFLKADIESYEYRMLLGVRRSIEKYHPLLAVCIYHNAVDLYDIPLLIKSIAPEYKIQIRHHADSLEETVLYAWVD